MDVNFRKIDIDQFDEDAIRDSEIYEQDPRNPADVLDDAKQRQIAVRGLLARNDIAGALTTILDEAPYGQNVDEAKLVTLQTLLTILNSTKSTEISNIIKALSVDTQDTLMKYIYKGMAMPGWGDVSGSVLLGWHEKLTEVAGVGCIVRTMTDRRILSHKVFSSRKRPPGSLSKALHHQKPSHLYPPCYARLVSLRSPADTNAHSFLSTPSRLACSL